MTINKNHTKMKKILLTIAAVVLSAGLMSAQDMAKATETAQLANETLQSGDKALALTGFEEALKMALECGDEGAELVGQCKGIIPNIMMSLAKDCLKSGDYDTAITKLADVAAKAKEFSVDEIADEAASLMPKAYMSKAGDLLTAKNFAGAIDAYKKVMELDPANGMAALRLGSAYAGTGKVEDAVAAFKTAAENGQAETANKQISNLYLKLAANALKTKNFASAIENANLANETLENPQAFLVAGQASQQLKKNADAIANFEKYLELSPKAKNAGAIAFTVAALYQQGGNKAKAVEYYNKVVSDPALGAQAKQQLDALK